MNDDRILLSETIERIGDAVDDIRTAVDMQSTGTIEDVADAVETLASNEYNAYKVGTVLDMGRFNASKLNDGDICTVMDTNHSYLPYRANVLTRALTFPKSFVASETEPGEFSDVNFSVYSGGSAFTAGGSVSLTAGGSGCSGGGTTSPSLQFSLVFNSTASTPPCYNFACYVTYDYDETSGEWVRVNFSGEDGVQEGVYVFGDTVIFPIECGFNKTGGGTLPVIIADCVKLHDYVVDPVSAGASATGSTTILKSHVYDGFFLPYTVVDAGGGPGGYLKNINPPLDGINFSIFHRDNNDYIQACTSAGSSIMKIQILYKKVSTNPTTYHLSEITVKNGYTNKYLYEYTNYDTTYANYDFYLYLPYEYYATASLQHYAQFFNQIAIEKPRTYQYDSGNGVWMRQL